MHVILAATFLFMAGCETTGNTTGSASQNTERTPVANGGISTFGTSNPAVTATNARGTLTEAATSTGTGTTNVTSANPPLPPAIAADGTNSASTMNTSPNNNISATASTANAGSPASFSVPSTYQSSFNTRYPQASNVQWSRYDNANIPIDWELTDWTRLGDNDYVVRYNMGTETYHTWYDAEGNWIGTSGTMKNMSGLPSAINTMLATKYKGYTISSANTEYWKDQTAYEIEMKNATTKVKLLVDANGNIIKEKSKVQ